jgi:hypothetical protein
MEFRRYTQDLEPAVAAFNVRLREGGKHEYQFPEKHVPDIPKSRGRDNHYHEGFLAYDRGHVRGGYLLLHQRFSVRGQVKYIGSFQLPLSEAVVDRKYNLVGPGLLRHAMQQYSMMYCLGIGSFEEPLTRLLALMGWNIDLVPFHFKVLNAARFLQEIRYLRATHSRCLLLDALRYSGLGWVGIRTLQLRLPSTSTAVSAAVDRFGPWADSVWERSNGSYSFVAVRDSNTLNSLYCASSTFLRYRISRAGDIIGWVVMLDTPMKDHKYFGNMRVGSIVDCMAQPEDANDVISCATHLLQQRGVDVIVTNQASSTWCSALSAHGFLKGPSNFLLALSQDLFRALQPYTTVKQSIHINRGDGDGPINL